ncbi:F-box protein CPR1-like [Papaver somniferum]|uniref:F-box protein CPR1-like n=1 Tax=Papaver somniferum TaxID=3469 RepID=UPI000E7060E7|nr:F-box protein CPR1-like [Papaver somniferum]
MASLPEDIIMDILLILPVKSISRFRCVCKLWYELFKNPNFIKTHHHRAIENNKYTVLLKTWDWSQCVFYSIDFDVTSSSYHMPVKTQLPPHTFNRGFDRPIVSCDGLIGLNLMNKICFWNPSTREYKCISTLDVNEAYYFLIYGVCYDWKICDYKLFKIVVRERHIDISSEIWVSRLGSNSWNNIGSIPYNIYRAKFCAKALNGIIHWLGKENVVVSFDIIEELTEEFQLPDCYINNTSYSPSDYMEVGVLVDDLYLLANATCGRSNIDLWVMKDYGVTDSWTKIFSLSPDITKFDKLLPLHYLNENHQILLKGEHIIWKEDALVSYDPKSGRLVNLVIHRLPRHFNATAFAASIVSLNSRELVKPTEISKVHTRHGAASIFSIHSRELVKAAKTSKVDTRHGAHKFCLLAVERVKSGYSELQSCSSYTGLVCSVDLQAIFSFSFLSFKV